ncbi:MAG: acyltransferase [Desulforudis sp.]|jgi:peptidoglycan/LPS O-acetylase OafA/YrhL|nr:MAG: acyltransferase [Desulforudis sp.]
MKVPSTLPYRKDIQGLRAIAIILVVLGHARIPAFSGGFVGVDVFFVLSGYLITGMLIHEYRNTQRIQIGRFISRRLKRLFPALLVMLVLVFAFMNLFLSGHEVKELGASFRYAISWMSNLFFAFSTIDYFAELRTRDLFLHTWSLGVEEQYYLIWPLLLLLILTGAGRFKKESQWSKSLLFALGFLFLSSLFLSLSWMTVHPLWSFYLMPSRMWQFALGSAVFVWLADYPNAAQPQNRSESFDKSIGTIGILLIMGSGVLLHSELAYPGWRALLPSLGAAMVIAAGTGGRFRILTHPLLVWIGNHSYSWYLWHWPVLMIGFSLGLKGDWVEIIILVALSLILATASYRWVELPFWKGRLSDAPPKITIASSLLVMLLVILVADYDFRIISQREKLQDNVAAMAKAARGDLPKIYAFGCDEWYASARVKPCLIGEISAQKTIVLLGDSVGLQWFSMFPEIYRSPEWRIVVLTKSSCAMVDEDYFYSRIGKNYDVCAQWRNATLDFIPTLQPDIIIVGSAATYNFTELQWVEGSTRIFDQLSQAADQVIVVPGTPYLSFDGPSCLERKNSKASTFFASRMSCAETFPSSQVKDVTNYLRRAASHFQNVRLLDLYDIVCPDSQCRARDAEGIIVFRDNQHLTDTFVRRQSPRIAERLKMMGAEPFQSMSSGAASLVEHN